jgi:hypothetical protein
MVERGRLGLVVFYRMSERKSVSLPVISADSRSESYAIIESYIIRYTPRIRSRYSRIGANSSYPSLRRGVRFTDEGMK